MKKEWNLQALAIAAQNDIAQCHTDHERFMATATNRKQMRELWQTIKASGRKVSPIEQAIAEQWGIE